MMRLGTWLIFTYCCTVVCFAQKRQEVIQDWIQRINEAPKGHHSLSPSFSSKSRIPVIGVGELPLQNEVNRRPSRQTPPSNNYGAASGFVSQRPGPKADRGPVWKSSTYNQGVSKTPIGYGRYGISVGEKTAEDFGLPALKPPKERFNPHPHHQHNHRPAAQLVDHYLKPFTAEEMKSDFAKLHRHEEPRQKPGPHENINYFTKNFKPASMLSFGHDFDAKPKRQLRLNKIRSPNFLEPKRQTGTDFHFDDNELFKNDDSHEQERIQNFRPPVWKSPVLREEQQVFHRQAPPQLSRPHKAPPVAPNHNFYDRHQLNEPLDILKPDSQPQPKASKRLQEPIQNSRPVEQENVFQPTPWTTTPRPIPTPGPEDFPPPPPRAPVAPPTHPTHPPLITHPSQHYLPVTQNYDHFDDYSNGEDDVDYDDRASKKVESEGFFTFPEDFPSLESLGAEFESMKIRNKRSSEDMEAEERRLFPTRRLFFTNGRNRRQNNDFSFQQSFWEDVNIDTRNVFPHGHSKNQYLHQQKYSQPPDSAYGLRNRLHNMGGPSRDPGNYSRYTLTNPHNHHSHVHRDPYTQQSVQSYPNDDFDDGVTYNRYDVAQNEILGSGNFEVVQGGTFYDTDTYQNVVHNRQPSNGNFLENFRDFADIKGDHYQYKKK